MGGGGLGGLLLFWAFLKSSRQIISGKKLGGKRLPNGREPISWSGIIKVFGATFFCFLSYLSWILSELKSKLQIWRKSVFPSPSTSKSLLMLNPINPPSPSPPISCVRFWTPICQMCHPMTSAPVNYILVADEVHWGGKLIHETVPTQLCAGRHCPQILSPCWETSNLPKLLECQWLLSCPQ